MSTAGPVNTVGEGGFRYEDEDTSDSLGVTLSGAVVGGPGEVRIDVDAEGRLGVSFGDIARGFNKDTINFVFSPEVPDELVDRVNEQFESLGDGTISSLGRDIADRVRDATNAGRNILSAAGASGPLSAGGATVGRQLWIGFFGEHIAGEQQVEFSETINSQPIPIPEFPNNPINIYELPPIILNVEARPTGAVQNALSGALGDRPQIQLEIPASAFFRTVSIDDIPCSQMFQNVADRLSEAEELVKDRLNGARPDLSDLQSVRDEITSIAGPNNLRDITLDDILQNNQDRLSRLRNRVENTREIDFSTISNAEDLRDEVEDRLDDVGGDCLDEFRDRLEELSSRLDELRDIRSNLNGLRDRLLDILDVPSVDCLNEYNVGSRVESIRERTRDIQSISDIQDVINEVESLKSDVRSDVPSGPCSDRFMSILDDAESRLRDRDTGLSCSDVSTTLRSSVSSFENSVDNFVDRDVTRRRIDRKNNLISNGRELISDIDREIDGANPCQSQLRSRVRSALSDIQDSASRGSLSCDGRYPDIDDELQQFQSDVISLSQGGVRQSEVMSIVSRGERLIDDIGSEVNSGCREQFLSTVRSAMNRARESTEGPSIRINIPEERIEESQQRIEELQNRIDNIIEIG